jgi:hypothetical protein
VKGFRKRRGSGEDGPRPLRESGRDRATSEATGARPCKGREKGGRGATDQAKNQISWETGNFKGNGRHGTIGDYAPLLSKCSGKEKTARSKGRREMLEGNFFPSREV